MMDGVSVVIPCYNEEAYIEGCLLGLLNNGFGLDNIELLIIDGQSTDNTLKIVSKLQHQYAQIKVIDNPKRKTPFALNLGIQNATYNFILIAGAHADYPKGYISTLYKLIQQPEIDVVGGAIETKAKNNTPKTRAITFVLSHPFGVGNSVFRVGADELLEVDTVPFGLYRKSIFDQVGLYNEQLIRNHDMELSTRIGSGGYRIWLDPTQKCTYYARESFKGLAKNNFDNGFWNFKTLAITGKFSSLSLRHYIPLLFVLSLIGPTILALLWNQWFLVISILSLASYLGLISIIALKNKKTRFSIVIWSFLVLHLSYGFGSLMGFLSWFKFWQK